MKPPPDRQSERLLLIAVVLIAAILTAFCVMLRTWIVQANRQRPHFYPAIVMHDRSKLIIGAAEVRMSTTPRFIAIGGNVSSMTEAVTATKVISPMFVRQIYITASQTYKGEPFIGTNIVVSLCVNGSNYVCRAASSNSFTRDWFYSTDDGCKLNAFDTVSLRLTADCWTTTPAIIKWTVVADPVENPEAQ